MKRLIEILFVTAAIAAPLSTLAQPMVQRLGDDRFKAVHDGESRDEVRAQLGSPTAPTAPRGLTNPGSASANRWTYTYTDTWGQPARFDVTFDASGKVASTSELRTLY